MFGAATIVFGLSKSMPLSIMFAVVLTLALPAVAAVFSVLRVVPLPRRLTGALEAESGLNDAPTVVLVTLVSSGADGDGPFDVNKYLTPIVIGAAPPYLLVASPTLPVRSRPSLCGGGRRGGWRVVLG